MCGSLAASLAFTATVQASIVIFEEDFNNTTLIDESGPYIGAGWSPQIGFGEFAGKLEVSVNDGALQVEPNSGYRGAGVILNPNLFTGSGEYTLKFDIVSFTGGADDSAQVSIWQGSGYDLSGGSQNNLQLNVEKGVLSSNGAFAESTELTRTSHTSTVIGFEQTFTYDGTSAIALFFGAETGGWPFPTVEYDNISIVSNTAAVPEPSSVALLGISSILLAARRRR